MGSKMTIRDLKLSILLGVSAAALCLSIPANAMITSISPTGGSIGDNVIDNPCTHGVASGSVIVGCLNSDHNSDIDFYSNELIQFAGGGQATVQAQDGLMNTITIDPVSFALSELIVNVDVSANGFAQFCDNASCFGTTFAVSSRGSNFFDISFNPSADYLTINTFQNADATGATQIIADTKQWRVAAGDTVTNVPEPGSLWITAPLMLLGFFGIGRLRKT